MSVNHGKKSAAFVGIGLAAVMGAGLMTAPDAEAATLTTRAKAFNVAKAQIGDWYQWGATGPSRFDCSGLTYYSYKKVGKTLPRVAQDQYNRSVKVSAANRKPGDLIFIGKSSKSIYHVGIYAGFWNGYGWMLDAPRTGRQVGYHKIKDYTAGTPYAMYGRY